MGASVAFPMRRIPEPEVQGEQRRRLSRPLSNLWRNRQPEIAVQLARMGLPVIPAHFPTRTGADPVCSCRKQHDDRKRIGKHPMGLLVPEWRADASSDPDEVREWWEEEPRANIGLVTGTELPCPRLRRGPKRYLVVVDIDPEGDEQLRLAGITLPPTFEVRTGRGRHLYYWTPVPVRSRNHLFKSPGVDIRGEGGYALAPGSLHSSGAVYTALSPVSDIVNVPQLPDGLMALMTMATDTSDKRRSTPTGTGKTVPIDTALPKLDDEALSPEILELLAQDLPVGERSEPDFAAERKLAQVTDDDTAILGTLLAHPLGGRLHQRSRSSAYTEIAKAREWSARSPDQQAAMFRDRQIQLVRRHFMACKDDLPTCTMKVLLAFYMISIDCDGGTFAASLAKVALKASVSPATAFRHRNRLVALGWLEMPYEAAPNTGLACRYKLTFPPGTPKEVKEAIYTPNVLLRSYLEYVPQGVGGVSPMTASCDQEAGRGRKILLRRYGTGSSAEGGFSGAEIPAEAGSRPCTTVDGKSAPPKLDLSEDIYRYNTNPTLWGVVPSLTGEGITPTELAAKLNKSPRQVRRYVTQLLELGLITDRHLLRLVPDWKQRLEALAEEKGTAGKREAALRNLEVRKLARRRFDLLRDGTGEWVDDGGVVVHATGEIV
jgi:hypothetical protein